MEENCYILDMRNITKTFPGEKALDNVDFMADLVASNDALGAALNSLSNSFNPFHLMLKSFATNQHRHFPLAIWSNDWLFDAIDQYAIRRVNIVF